MEKVLKINNNPLKNDAGLARRRFLRESEKRRFFSEVQPSLALSISNPEAQPAAHQVAPTKKNNGIMASKKQRILEALNLRRKT